LPGERLKRHRHCAGFAAVVLGGSYVEAGDSGRHGVAAGDVIRHHAFESHLDQIDIRGAEVLVIPLARVWTGPIVGRASDPDLLVRLTEKAPAEAAEALEVQMTPRLSSYEDWPDILANDIIANPNMGIAHWAETRGLHPGSVSRGFRQQFGVTPAGFCLSIRAGRAARAILDTSAPLAQVALACSFVDQAHMCNVIRNLTGLSPSRLRDQGTFRRNRLPSFRRVAEGLGQP
jgi:AraC-like DNA-binding protein